jgi:hypothetical protein
MILSILTIQMTSAQSRDYRWTSPERLSSEQGQSSPPYMVSDQYGFIHLFWTESGFADTRPFIRYSRFDGETWSVPNDIYIADSPESTVVFISPFVDSEGMLHIIWSEGILGPLMYTRAPAYDAISAKNWLKPVTIDATSFFGSLVVDSKGVLHVIYSDFYGEVPGIYYIRSEDDGQTWSTPLWLDPDIPEGQGSTNINLGIDENDGLHALWHYIDTSSANGTWIRYAHSMDGGNTWTIPTTIDMADESYDELRMPYPEFLVSGEQVHIIWAGNSRTNREYRYSTNAGQTLSPTTRILGDLIGQALGGGLAVDSLGRVHYATQVRDPLGIYHTIWENGSWSIPNLIYFIGNQEVDPSKIHAHNVRMAIRAGNQVVVAFTSSPLDPQMSLYVIHSTLNDVPAIPPLPTPTPSPADNPISTPTIDSASGTLTPLSPEIASPPTAVGQPSLGIIWGAIPALLLLCGMIVYQVIRRR